MSRAAGRTEDFTCLSALPGETAQVRFTGPFEGRTICWEMRLQTLAHWLVTAPGSEPDRPEPPGRGVIEVGAEHDGRRELLVALDVARIDLPTVRKAVVMIRNYRGLRPGRHTWGAVETRPAARGGEAPGR